MDKATPATLTEFKDAIASSIISIESTWSVEFRTYRSQVKKKIDTNNNYNNNLNDNTTNKEAAQNESERNNVLYSLLFPQKEKNVLIKNKIAIVTTTSLDVDSENSSTTGTSNNVRKLIDSSSSVWYPEPIDNIISNKLSNMWTQRQLIKGDTGESFITQDGLLIKCCNLSSSFGFKGLLIELKEIPKTTNPTSTTTTTSVNDNSNYTFCVKTILDILKTIGMKNYKISNDTLNEDMVPSTDYNTNENTELCNLAYQYVNVLD